MNAPDGLVTQDTLDGLTDLPHFRGAQKPTCPHSRRQLLANAAIAALARRLIAVRRHRLFACVKAAAGGLEMSALERQ
jgi:hypothetical protein